MKYTDQPLLFASVITLSFVGSSVAMLAYWISALFFNQVKPVIENLTNIQSMQNISPIYFIMLGSLYFMSLVGILKMWNWQKAGYFFYIGAQICIWAVPLIWLGKNSFSSTNTIFTLVFIGIYTSYLKAFMR